MKLVKDLISVLQLYSTSLCFFPTTFCFNKAKNIVLSGMELMGKNHGKPEIERKNGRKSREVEAGVAMAHQESRNISGKTIQLDMFPGCHTTDYSNREAISKDPNAAFQLNTLLEPTLRILFKYNFLMSKMSSFLLSSYAHGN